MIDKHALDNEVNLIVNDTIKDFTKKCLAMAPDYFWTIPSSSTGKHHPADENVEGGKRIHTQKVVKVANALCTNFDIKGADKDCVISATTLHDICSQGYPLKENFTVSGHGSLFGRLVWDLHMDVLNNQYFSTICRLVATHMGKWDVPYVVSGDKLMIVVQISDYIASRKFISIDLKGEDK